MLYQHFFNKQLYFSRKFKFPWQHFIFLLCLMYPIDYWQMRTGITATTANILCSVLLSCFRSKPWKTVSSFIHSPWLTELEQCPATIDILAIEYRAISGISPKVKICCSGNATGISVRFLFHLIIAFLQVQEGKKKSVLIWGNCWKKSPFAPLKKKSSHYL